MSVCSQVPSQRGVGALISWATALHGFGGTQKGFPVAEVSSSVAGSVSSCKDLLSFVSLGLGCLDLLVLLPNKEHLQRAEHPWWVQRVPGDGVVGAAGEMGWFYWV